MRFELGRRIGVAVEICLVGIAFLEQHVHDGAGERRIGAGPDHQMQIRRLGRAGAIGIDHDQLGLVLGLQQRIDRAGRQLRGCRPRDRRRSRQPSRHWPAPCRWWHTGANIS